MLCFKAESSRYEMMRCPIPFHSIPFYIIGANSKTPRPPLPVPRSHWQPTALRMEITDENVSTLLGYLEKTLGPSKSVIDEAESFLTSSEPHAGYPVLVLRALEMCCADPDALHVAQAAAITFKNYVARNWVVVSHALFSLLLFVFVLVLVLVLVFV